MKRRNNNSQLSKEAFYELESNENESAEVTKGFQRASADVLKQRRIVQVKKRKPTSTKPAQPIASSEDTKNPFSGFSGFTAEKKSTDQPTNTNPFSGFTGFTEATAKPATTNPFAGFTGFTAKESTTKTEQSNSTNPFSGFTGFTQEPTKSEKKEINAQNDKEFSSFQEAVKHLNQQFVQFIQEQIENNAATLWVEGMKDYITQYEQFKKQFSYTPIKKTVLEKKEPANDTDGVDLSENSNGTNTTSHATNAIKPKSNEKPFSGFSFDANPTSKPVSTEKPFSGFNFSANPTSKPSSTEKPFTGFNSNSNEKDSTFNSNAIPKGSANDKPFTGFTLNTNPNASKPTESSSSASGFSFAPSVPPTQADNDDENVGKSEPTVVLNAEEDSESNETATFTAERAKLLELQGGAWKDKGVHPIKILVDNDTKDARILIRNSIGKVMLNGAIYKGLKVMKLEGKNKVLGVKFTLILENEPRVFAVKINGDLVSKLQSAIEAAANRE